MTRVLENRNPTHAELFRGLAAAMQRLSGMCDNTAAAIQTEMCADEPDFQRAAEAIGVPLDDLVDVFEDELFKGGFLIQRRWAQ